MMILLQQLFLVKVSLLRKSFGIPLFVILINISDDLIFVRNPFFSWKDTVSVIAVSYSISRYLIKYFHIWDRRRDNFCH